MAKSVLEVYQKAQQKEINARIKINKLEEKRKDYEADLILDILSLGGHRGINYVKDKDQLYRIEISGETTPFISSISVIEVIQCS